MNNKIPSSVIGKWSKYSNADRTASYYHNEKFIAAIESTTASDHLFYVMAKEIQELRATLEYARAQFKYIENVSSAPDVFMAANAAVERLAK